jgi:hypothetical protein
MYSKEENQKKWHERRSLIMKSFQNRMLAIAALRFVAICARAIPAGAQNVCGGSFTLPQEVHWQGTTFPAGDYTFLLNSFATPCQITLHGPNGLAFVSAIVPDKQDAGDSSVLTIGYPMRYEPRLTSDDQECTTLDNPG